MSPKGDKFSKRAEFEKAKNLLQLKLIEVKENSLEGKLFYEKLRKKLILKHQQALETTLNNHKEVCDHKNLNEILKNSIDRGRSRFSEGTNEVEEIPNNMDLNFTPKSEIKADSDWTIALGTPSIVHPLSFKSEQDVLNSFGGRLVQVTPEEIAPNLKKRNHRRDKIAKYVRNDNKERPFGCEKCFKRFTSQANLELHKRIHSNIRFECEICTKKFVQKGQLQVHMKTHTGQKDYVCTICQKGYIQKVNLNSHMTSAHGINLKELASTPSKLKSIGDGST